MGDEDLTQFDPEGRRRGFSAYYYSLDATPSPEINAVLRAVARAGKMFHHTEGWNDSYYDGEEPTAAEMIQAAADEAAATIAATEAEVARLRKGTGTAAGDLATEHFRDPEDTRLCRGCRGMWPCISSGVAADLRALLAEEETT